VTSREKKIVLSHSSTLSKINLLSEKKKKKKDQQISQDTKNWSQFVLMQSNKLTNILERGRP
jgi:hypothetical protein